MEHTTVADHLYDAHASVDISGSAQDLKIPQENRGTRELSWSLLSSLFYPEDSQYLDEMGRIVIEHLKNKEH